MTTTVDAPVAGPPAPPAERRPRRAAWLLFPILLTLVFGGLVAADLNGSSIGVLRTAGGADPALVAGTPRDIRTDETFIATPIAVSQARQGFPAQPYIGLTPTQQEAVPHGGPTTSPLELLKPQNWGYLTLGASRGLAVHWWFPFLVSLAGMYWLLLVLRVRPFVAAALAVVATMTPYNAWWSSPAPALEQGFAALAATAAILGLRSARRWAPLLWGLAAGAAGTALFLTLYPPWLVSLALVVAALVLGYAIDVRAGLRRVLGVLAGVLLVALPTLGHWLTSNRAAIDATTGTFYPGQRVSQPGEAIFSWLLSAPLNPILSGGAGRSLDPDRSGVPFTNQSEVSAAWLPLPVLLVAVLVVLLRRRAAEPAEPGGGAAEPAAPGRWTALLLAASIGLLLAWAVLPLPEWTGTLLLERVKGTRVPLALCFGGVLLVAIAGGFRPRARFLVGPLWLAAIAGTAALTVWASRELPWRQGMVSDKVVLVSAVVVAAGFGLVAAGWWRRTAALVLACFAFWSWALVNPLYQGLGALDDDPTARALRPLAEADPGARALVFGDEELVAVVRGTGLQALGGTTFYPNEELMRRLVPAQRTLWNNHATYRFRADPAATRARIQQIRGTTMELTVNPCSPDVAALGARYAVSATPVEAPCLRLREEVRSGGPSYVYEVTT